MVRRSDCTDSVRRPGASDTISFGVFLGFFWIHLWLNVPQWFEDNVPAESNLIILGDFNLEPRGDNAAAPDATAWTELLEAGWCDLRLSPGPFQSRF